MSYDTARIIFRNIFIIFPNLVNLRLDKFPHTDLLSLSFNREIPMFSSSTLLELHIDVCISADLLYLFDGRLSHV